MQSTLSPSRKKSHRKVLVVGADTFRPAAVKQLEVLINTMTLDNEEGSIGFFSDDVSLGPAEICSRGLLAARQGGYDTVIVDTAGRQSGDEAALDELNVLKKSMKPLETLLVVDSMTGQEAATMTKNFDDAVGLTGAVLTKTDGDNRGGSAVSVRGVSGVQIKFMGVGERSTDLEEFYPDRMASRILGKGDIVSLVEKAERVKAEGDNEKADEIVEKMKSATFDFDDFVKQAEMIERMGSISSMAKLIPGLGSRLSDDKMDAGERKLRRAKSFIGAMTDEERRSPELFINGKEKRSKLERIAKDSGNK